MLTSRLNTLTPTLTDVISKEEDLSVQTANVSCRSVRRWITADWDRICYTIQFHVFQFVYSTKY